MTGRPPDWKTGLPAKPCALRSRRPRIERVQHALLKAIDYGREQVQVDHRAGVVARIALASPHQSVAQKTMLCSVAIAWTLLAVTSVCEPSSPCP